VPAPGARNSSPGRLPGDDQEPVSIRAAGDRGLLVELPDLDTVLAVAGWLRALALPEVEDIVPAARTVLIRVRPGTSLGQLRGEVTAIVHAPGDSREDASMRAAVVLPVHYDGPDLEEVAASCGMTGLELIRAHTGSRYRAAFLGFAPGFCYLTGGNSRLLGIQRRSTSRIRVPAGAVALAGEFGAVYPRESPGGWQLIGRTDVSVWNSEAAQPALIAPGRQVRFVDADNNPAIPGSRQ